MFTDQALASGLSTTDTLVLVALIQEADVWHIAAAPNRLLAERSRCSTRTVQRALRHLAEHGYVRDVGREPNGVRTIQLLERTP